MNKPTYIDLFSGAGGLSYGFDKMNFENIFSVDIEPDFCKTYHTNFPKHYLIQDDIANITKNQINKIINGKEIDVIIGGCPCQGFSMAGNPGRKFIDDPRNHLFKEFARIVSIVNPKYFVIENVARLFTHKKGKTKEEIISLFSTLGYTVDCKVINSADYGVAQIRKRIIFIGNRISNKLEFPVQTIKTPKSIKDAISHFPALKSGESSEIPNHIAMNHSEQMLKKMSFISDGGDRTEIPIKYRPDSGDVRKYIKYKSDSPSICITGDMRKVFHYSQNRALTVRELASIQSFPDSFIFRGSITSQQQQVGNSVPPLMAIEIAKSILKMKKYDQ